MPLPGVVTKLGAARVREMIFAAALLPPEGTSIVDSSPWLVATMARRAAKKNVPSETPKPESTDGLTRCGAGDC
jgi:hypothetical protein